MAIKIRKKVKLANETAPVLEPDVVDSGGDLDVKVPAMDDSFLATSHTVIGWMMEHRRLLSFVVAMLVLLSVSIVAFRYHNETRTVERSSVLSDALVTYGAMTTEEANILEAMDAQRLAEQGIAATAREPLRVSYSVPSDTLRHEAIVAYLGEALDAYSGSGVAELGRLMAAGSLMRLARDEEAASIYEGLRQSEREDVRLFALLGAAESLIGVEKYEEAVAVYDEVAAISGSYGSFAALSKGRLYEVMGERDKAILAYSSVLQEFGQASDQQVAMARLRLLTPDWAERVSGQANSEFGVEVLQ